MENNENTGSVNVAGQTPDIATLCGSGGVIVEIGWARFPKSGKQAMAGSDDASFKAGDVLLVRTERGDIYARAMTDSVRRVHLTADFVKIVRVLPKEEAEANLARDVVKEQESRKVFVEQVRKHGLDMHLSEVEITHGDSRIVFYFTSPGRVDFRALVRELAGALKSRIELRQIGVRDEARCTGGLGPCGLPLCCSSFLREFTTVTIRMAKVQGLVPNPQKVSGLCGRLMCCLAYEHGVYTDMMKDLPKAGSAIMTPKGEGRVKEVMVMRNVIKVALGPGVVEEFTLDQLGCACAGGCQCGTDSTVVADSEDPPAPEGAETAEKASVRRPKPRPRRPDRPVNPKQP
jgi:cell fate regulator YaaT (PSP1 superfamily)